METSQTVLKLLNKTYYRIQSSKIHGVGVFAIRTIPANINPFEGVEEKEWFQVSIRELRSLDPSLIEMVQDFFVVRKDGIVDIPKTGLNGIDISFFMNTSKEPNVISLERGCPFRTSRTIQKGEELTISYEDLSQAV